MERKLEDVGHRVETEPGCGLISDITHAAPGRGEGGKIGADAKGRIGLQAVLKKAAAAMGNGIHERANEVAAYARRKPVGALTAATGVGFLVGLCLARGSRATTGGKMGWLSELNSRRSVLGRRTGSGWRRLLGLE
jgi:hypothetical protein